MHFAAALPQPLRKAWAFRELAVEIEVAAKPRQTVFLRVPEKPKGRQKGGLLVLLVPICPIFRWNLSLWNDVYHSH